MSLRRLEELVAEWSPWRSEPTGWWRKDPLIKRYEESVLKRPPRLFYHVRKNIVKPGKYGIVTIRGPRRVGKTTMLRLLVRELIERHGVSPQSVFYVSLDDVRLEGFSLLDVLKYAASRGVGEKYVILDEVSRDPRWARALKNAYDLGVIDWGRLKIIATGSHSMDLAEAVAQLRGRQGELAREFNVGGNLLQPPFRFSEVVEGLRRDVDEFLRASGLRRADRRFQVLVSLAEGRIPEDLEWMHQEYFQLLREVFEAYLLHGGFPIAVNEYYRNGRIDPSTYGSHAEIVVHDAEEAGLDRDTLKRVIQVLFDPERIANLVNLAGLTVTGRDDRGAASPPRKFGLRKYIDYLRTAWIVFLGYAEEGKHGSCQPNYQSHQKVWVLDPFMYFALLSYVNNIPDPYTWARQQLDTELKGRLVECVVASHLILAQQLFEHVPSVDYDKVLMYRRGAEGTETDFVLCVQKAGKHHRLLVEVKYRKSTPSVQCEEGKIILTRDTFTVKNNMAYIPVSLFLMLF